MLQLEDYLIFFFFFLNSMERTISMDLEWFCTGFPVALSMLEKMFELEVSINFLVEIF